VCRRAAFARVLERRVDKTAAQSLARYVAALLQGLSIHARGGATAPEFRTSIDVACRDLAAVRSGP